MIRNEKEYDKTRIRLKEDEELLAKQKDELRKQGVTGANLRRAMAPLNSFHAQLREEVESYERLKRGDLGEIQNLHDIGRILIGARIALGITQRQLAEKLGVNESQVSRDERNDYFGVSVQRAAKILDALGVRLNSTVELGRSS